MFPFHCLARLNHRINTMTCKTPCSDCSCKETVYNSDYQELDSCPIGTLQARYFEELEATADRIISELLEENA